MFAEDDGDDADRSISPCVFQRKPRPASLGSGEVVCTHTMHTMILIVNPPIFRREYQGIQVGHDSELRTAQLPKLHWSSPCVLAKDRFTIP